MLLRYGGDQAGGVEIDRVEQRPGGSGHDRIILANRHLSAGSRGTSGSGKRWFGLPALHRRLRLVFAGRVG
ncbi:MAG: hypothetical protein WDN69_20575 [Aliidongia sp.]